MTNEPNNARPGHHRDYPKDTLSLSMCALAETEALDTAILTAIREAGGGPLRWTTVRAQVSRKFPNVGPWRLIQALCRLRAEGIIIADKYGGATFVAA